MCDPRKLFRGECPRCGNPLMESSIQEIGDVLMVECYCHYQILLYILTEVGNEPAQEDGH